MIESERQYVNDLRTVVEVTNFLKYAFMHEMSIKERLCDYNCLKVSVAVILRFAH